VKIKVKDTLFNLGMVTYSYERQDIIQFALKRHRKGDSAVKKTLSDLALPLHVADEFLEKCSYNVNLIRHTIN
jgi:hypothetical protein